MSIGISHKTEKSFPTLQFADLRYPAALRAFLDPDAPAAIAALGDLAPGERWQGTQMLVA